MRKLLLDRIVSWLGPIVEQGIGSMRALRRQGTALCEFLRHPPHRLKGFMGGFASPLTFFEPIPHVNIEEFEKPTTCFEIDVHAGSVGRAWQDTAMYLREAIAAERSRVERIRSRPGQASENDH